MDISAVETSYARWAPVYDKTFGAITNTGRKTAVSYINTRAGSVLEVGVGTGLSLPLYAPQLSVTGIDFSHEMLGKAREKVNRLGLEHVKDLRQMDARTLDFPDNHFDTVAAMHVLSVVPDPRRVMSEIARVCKPGGKVVITNHFKREASPLSLFEKALSPFANTIGWHSDFEMATVLKEKTLSIEEQRVLPPLKIMTFMVLAKA